MCPRAVQVIPGLFRAMNRHEERERLAREDALKMKKLLFWSWFLFLFYFGFFSFSIFSCINGTCWVGMIVLPLYSHLHYCHETVLSHPQLALSTVLEHQCDISWNNHVQPYLLTQQTYHSQPVALNFVHFQTQYPGPHLQLPLHLQLVHLPR
ncbi:hypothetical protein LXL04_030383 [Taraxacum kok-saghyz]